MKNLKQKASATNLSTGFGAPALNTLPGTAKAETASPEYGFCLCMCTG